VNEPTGSGTGTTDPVRTLVEQVTARMPPPVRSDTTTRPRAKIAKAETGNSDTGSGGGAGGAVYRAVTVVVGVLRQLGPDKVIAGLWPGSLLVHGAIVRDIRYRYTILEHPKAKIARDIGQPEYLVSFVLDRTGTPRHRGGKRQLWTAEQIAELRRRHRIGEPVEVIAAALGVSEYWVGLKLVDLGLADPMNVHVRPLAARKSVRRAHAQSPFPSRCEETPT
jgi:hypothetical protein